MSKLFIICMVFCNLLVEAQQMVIVRRDSVRKDKILIKWYADPLISPEGSNIYRRGTGEGWTKINTFPIRQGEYQIPADAFKKDTDLKSYIQLAKDPKALKGITFLALLIKSFTNEHFSRYLGLRYDDTTITAGRSYEYMVTRIINGKEVQTLASMPISSESYPHIKAPDQLKLTASRRTIDITWLPEPDRYYGTNIFRADSGSTLFSRLNRDPIILSRKTNAGEAEAYGAIFYSDGTTIPGKTYKYYIEGCDYFGLRTLSSNTVLIRFKDSTPPTRPDMVHTKLNGKSVSIHWNYRSRVDDLDGFDVYRTTENDTDFKKLNSVPLHKSVRHYEDTVKSFGSYFYKVAARDKDENAGITNPVLTEVYDNEPPQSPINLVVTADSGLISLAWQKNKETDIKGYLIYRAVDADNLNTYVRITPDPVADTVFIDKVYAGVKNRFIYRVVTVDHTMNRSAYSASCSIRLPDRLAPSSPFLKEIRLQNESALISWFVNPEPDLAFYTLYRKEQADTAAERINLLSLKWDASNFTDRQTHPGKSYEYYLRASDSTGNHSAPSNKISIRIPALAKTKPEIEAFKIKDNVRRNTVELKWKIKSADGLQGCIIYKSQGNSRRSITGLLTENWHEDTEIQTNSTYRYEIRAYNKQGDFTRSESITINTKSNKNE